MAAKPRRRRLAKFFGQRPDPRASTSMHLAPRRLEPRRMLDAAAGALALEMFDASSEFVQAGSDFAPQALSTDEAAAASANSSPANIQIQPMGSIDENGVATLELVFEDADPLDSHTVEVRWGDGAIELFNVPSGSQFFGTTHQYMDDDPSVTSSDIYTVNVKVIDSGGDFAEESADVTVNNVAPSNLQIAPPAPIDENGIGTLELTFDDPGSLDSHTVEVDWGDGSAVEVFNVPQGSRFFGTTHQYLDDDPTGTSADDYTINVRVLDDDGGEIAGSATINVSNIAPSNVQIAPMTTIDENGLAKLNLTFDDPGTLDSHKVEVDWGDGTVETLNVAPGSRAFSASHQYLDDDPTGTSSDSYAVQVRLLDDDLGEVAADPVSVTVNNVAPSGVAIDPLAPIDENGVAVLNLAFTDPGTLDAHMVEIDWGDGSPLEVLPVAAGARVFSANHQYLDDDPTGTASDSYSIKVRLLDDDLGAYTANAVVLTVNNVAPANVQVLPTVTTSNEGALVNLTLTFDDPGSLDIHTYEVDWGDGTTATVGAAIGHSIAASHTYADDGAYTVKVKVVDDDGGVGTAMATVNIANLAPTLTVVGNQTVNEGSQLSLTNIGAFTDPGFDNPLNVLDPANGGETLETFTYTVNWGDGTASSVGSATIDVMGGVGTPTSGSFDGQHTYADNGVYTVTVTVFDDDGGEHQQTFQVTVSNVAPTLTVVGNQTVNEGAPLSLTNIGTFTDPGFNNPLNPLPGGELSETFTFTINWGDGTANSAGAATVDAPGGVGTPTSGSFDGLHTYADNGVYTVTVTVFDDDGGAHQQTFQVTVANVAPTLTVVGNQSVNEGSQLPLTNIGTFTDPGFNNPLNPLPGGELSETFTYTINWGDGTTNSAGAATVDAPGSVGVPTAGSFDGLHTYADNGVYTVTVTVFDDDGGEHQQSFQVTVSNVAPTLTVVGNQSVNEGSQLSLTNIGTFTDPGFNNPLNPLPGGETTETFTFTINWGDGTSNSAGAATVDVLGNVGTPTSGSFDGLHTYADNGVYTVTVTVFDDDGGQHLQTFQVTVLNVAPTLTVVGNQTINEGSQLSLTNIGTFTDPGFDNPLNPLPGGELSETFTFTVNWGDGTANSAGAATVDVLGGVGTPTSGSFDGLHTYADNGVYTVTVTVFDDDGGQHLQTFQVTVLNVAPTLTVVGDQSVDEGAQISLTNIGTFTDPGFNNPLNPLPGGETTETFTFTINWGDGTANSAGAATVDALGSIGVPTAGSFDGQHTYADNGVYTVSVTVFDDDGGQHLQTFLVTVQNVAPTLQASGNQTINEGSSLSLANVGTFTDPGFNNPLNPLPGGETAETFTFTINWGDGTAVDGGAATVDILGAIGTPTAGSFDGLHTYADNGVYTVTVTVFDDDGGQHQKTFEVTVLNVAPTLGVVADQTANEGSLLQLVNIGAITDPGFNNPLNPLPGGETTETFTFTINWGDGTANSAGAATVDVLGGVGTLTAASFDGSHHYADDGVYTVTVTVLDDDGGQDVKTFLVTVNNVAPTLNLTVDASLIDAIDEGGITEVNITGLFSDPGFDNPNNTALVPGEDVPETEETFTYEVDWGDGETETFSLADLNGGPGVDSTGAISQFFTHQYIDNDLDGVRDARYTVTVTVFDDDGGSNAKTFEVIVYNTNPTLAPVAATSVNTEGETTLTLTFDDLGAPGVESFEILIDWGDQLTNPNPVERFVVEDTYDASTPNTFTFTHKYLGPPDPLHPAADIVISVKIQDDDFGTLTSRPDADPLTIDGESNIETVAITNPGLGAEPFRIDTTPQVAILTFPERVAAAVDLVSAEVRGNTVVSGDEGGSAGDSRATSERYLELRVINPDGSLGEGYRLPSAALNNLQALFRKLPDNHYAIYLVQSETNVRRLVIDVFVRNGKVIDPGDDSEGARDRPPTDEATTAPAEVLPEELPAADDGAATSSAVEPKVGAEVGRPLRHASSTAVYHRTALAGVALALSGAGRDWQRQIEQALVKAKPSEWKRLRTAGHRRKRKPK